MREINLSEEVGKRNGTSLNVAWQESLACITLGKHGQGNAMTGAKIPHFMTRKKMKTLVLTHLAATYSLKLQNADNGTCSMLMTMLGLRISHEDRWGKFLPIVTLHSRNCVANVAAITIVVWLAIDAMQGGWPEPAVIVGSYDRFQVGPGHNDFIKHIRRL